jgi:hypothetical protein
LHGLGSFDKEWDNTLELPLGQLTVRVLKLARIIKSKETLGREKDRLVLPVLRDAMATIELQKEK